MLLKFFQIFGFHPHFRLSGGYIDGLDLDLDIDFDVNLNLDLDFDLDLNLDLDLY